MYEEDFIFGPLTWKQFVFLAGGIGVVAIAYQVVPDPSGTMIAVVAAGMGVLFAYNNRPTKIPLDQLAMYLEQKRSTLGDDAYKQYLVKLITQHKAQMQITRERGDDPDFERTEALRLLETAFKDVSNLR